MRNVEYGPLCLLFLCVVSPLVIPGPLCGRLVQGHPELGLGRAMRLTEGTGERLHRRDLRSGVHQSRRTPPVGQDSGRLQ